MTTNAPNEIVQKALKYVGAGKEVEGALHTYGIQHLEQILVLRIEDLMEADMSLTQIVLLRQIAEDMLEETMKQDLQGTVALKRETIVSIIIMIIIATHPKVQCKVSHSTQQGDAKCNEPEKRVTSKKQASPVINEEAAARRAPLSA